MGLVVISRTKLHPLLVSRKGWVISYVPMASAPSTAEHVVHDENSHYNADSFAWLEPNGDVREVGPMLIVARIDPTHVTTMCNLVGHAQDYINIAMADAGKGLLAQVQAMTPEERMALPTGVYFALPTDDDIKQTR